MRGGGGGRMGLMQSSAPTSLSVSHDGGPLPASACRTACAVGWRRHRCTSDGTRTNTRPKQKPCASTAATPVARSPRGLSLSSCNGQRRLQRRAAVRCSYIPTKLTIPRTFIQKRQQPLDLRQPPTPPEIWAFTCHSRAADSRPCEVQTPARAAARATPRTRNDDSGQASVRTDGRRPCRRRRR